MLSKARPLSFLQCNLSLSPSRLWAHPSQYAHNATTLTVLTTHTHSHTPNTSFAIWTFSRAFGPPYFNVSLMQSEPLSQQSRNYHLANPGANRIARPLTTNCSTQPASNRACLRSPSLGLRAATKNAAAPTAATMVLSGPRSHAVCTLSWPHTRSIRTSLGRCSCSHGLCVACSILTCFGKRRIPTWGI